MGTHSAFFGPSKYGILPEMLRARDLPRANGIILMTTFLAIIFGTVLAGLLCDLAIEEGVPLDATAHRLWIASVVCMGIAVTGTLTSLLVRRVPAAVPNLQFTWSALTDYAREPPACSVRDRPLLGAVFASSIFWLVSGVAFPAVNSLGKIQLELSDYADEHAARLYRDRHCRGIGPGRSPVARHRGFSGHAAWAAGAWSCSLVGGRHCRVRSTVTCSGFAGTFVALIVMGTFAGMYAIPLQVFMQSRPPEGQKGRMIAVMNQANFVAIMLSAGRVLAVRSIGRPGRVAAMRHVCHDGPGHADRLVLYRPRGHTDVKGQADAGY